MLGVISPIPPSSHCQLPSLNVAAFIHVFIQSFMLTDGEINTSHELWMLYHLHTLQQQRQHPPASYTFVFLLFCSPPPWCDSSSPNGWHCDHGCHTTHAVFSKTAEDSLAHVTTASRLTCYHGDKQANENSADGCDVDCKLFVLRGDLFFFSLSLSPPPHLTPHLTPHFSLHSYSDADPATPCTCTQTFTLIKKTWEGYSHTHVHVHTRTPCEMRL